MAITFLEAGTDATFGFEWWNTTTGTVSSDTSLAHTGPRSIKMTTVASSSSSLKSATGVLGDLGRRICFWLNITTLETVEMAILQVFGSVVGIFDLTYTSGGVLRLRSEIGAGAQLGSDGPTLATGIWYHITVAYTINSTTSYTINVYVNGALGLSVTNGGALGDLGSDSFFIGYFKYAGGGNPTGGRVNNFDDIYVDDATTLDFPGLISVVAKQPAVNNITNFDTNIGANPANRWTNVNERPLSTTNGWRQVSYAQVGENYRLDGPTSGDSDTAVGTLLGWSAWLWGSKGPQVNQVDSISFVSGVAASAATVTFAQVSANNVIYVFAYRDNNATAPSLAAGYTHVASYGANVQSAELAFRVASGTEVSTGTFTNATGVVALILRGANTTSSVGAFLSNNGNSSNISYPSLTLSATNSSSWVLGFAGAKVATAGMDGAVSGLKNEANVVEVNGLDTESGVSTFVSAILSYSGPGRWVCWTVEALGSAASAGSPMLQHAGAQTAITLSTVASLFTFYSATSLYPNNNVGIGMRSTGTSINTNLYECGFLLASIPNPEPYQPWYLRAPVLAQ